MMADEQPDLKSKFLGLGPLQSIPGHPLPPAPLVCTIDTSRAGISTFEELAQPRRSNHTQYVSPRSEADAMGVIELPAVAPSARIANYIQKLAEDIAISTLLSQFLPRADEMMAI